MKILPKFLISIIYLFPLASIAFAHEGEEEATGAAEQVAEPVKKTLEDTLRSNSIKSVVLGSFIILLFVFLTILLKERYPALKKYLFLGIIIPTILVTVYLSGSTIYLNTTSSTGGPVHWHADFIISDCGKEIELKNPEGVSNRVGSATFHEHNDGRMHVEGVVVDKNDASLGNFFKFVGGELTNDEMHIPTEEGMVDRHNGDLCDNEEGTLQVFVYKTVGKLITQQKLEDPASYVISPYGNVPPGDCLIIDFDSEVKEMADKICNFYKLKLEQGELKYGY